MKNMNLKTNRILFLFYITLFLQCGPEKPGNADSSLAFALLAPSENSDQILEVTTVPEGSHFITTVKATSSFAWVYVDLGSGGIKSSENEAWDLRWKRFVGGTNGGTSGTGTGGSCKTNSTNWADTFTFASCMIENDALQSQTGDGGFGSANESASPSIWGWYNYDANLHQLSSKNEIYLIRSFDSADFYVIQMLDYYSAAGTSGYPKFRWKKL
ncbi:HmuY family protein [Leptospira sp. WS92.C1]